MTTIQARTVTAGYIQVPFQVSFREVPLRSPAPHEVLLDVLACGICGHDLEIASQLAQDARPFGHEIAGVVREVGEHVTHVQPGDQVALESGSFCGECALCRNGRVDLCNKAPGFWTEPAMGFSAAMVVNARCVVPAPDMDPHAAALAEPCGVAVDMIKVAEIGLTDRVLVVGTGAIGLMALAIVRRRTGGTIVAANPSPEKLEIAKRLGADAVVNLRETPLAECGKPFGGFDRVLSTAPPKTLPDSLAAAAYGGNVTYIGFDWGPGGIIQLDTTAMHLGKKQLRASFASPAVYLPEALHLLRSGVVPAAEIISHRFPLSRLEEALKTARDDRAHARKVLVIPD
ncbi:MAG: zinc-dependent alcohol dehydrogenase [Armatimonadota bacterium]